MHACVSCGKEPSCVGWSLTGGFQVPYCGEHCVHEVCSRNGGPGQESTKARIHVPPKASAFAKPDGTLAYRPRREQIYMEHAAMMASQATCDRLQVGAVFTDARMMRVLCSGYNGNYSGGPNGCETLNPGNCGCLHAELNALTKSREDLQGCTCFVTTQPCKMCAKILVNRGVSRVVYLQSYRLEEGIDILRASGVEVVRYSDLPG